MKIDYFKLSQKSSAPPPSKEYFEGRNAYPKLGCSQNPYPNNTKEHEDWEHGWCDAQGYDEYTHSSSYAD